MSAYLIVHGTARDADKLKQYADQAIPMIEAAGGEKVVRAVVTEILVGRHDHDLCAVFRFPDGDTLRSWYHSAAYQALVPLREAAADMVFIVIEEPSA